MRTESITVHCTQAAKHHHHPRTFQSPDVSLAVSKQSLARGFRKLKDNFYSITFARTGVFLTVKELWTEGATSSTW